MRLLAVPVTLLATLAFATPAPGQDEVIAPPGNAGVEEYLEIVPGAGGDKPAAGGDKRSVGGGESGSSTAPTPAEALGTETARKLEAMGPDGRAAAAAAAAGSPTDRATARQRAKAQILDENEVSADKSIAAESGGGDRVTSVARAIGGDGGGMGLLFPILLAATLSLAIATAVARLRRRA